MNGMESWINKMMEGEKERDEGGGGGRGGSERQERREAGHIRWEFYPLIRLYREKKIEFLLLELPSAGQIYLS